jgi:O-acetyl-ADP-ribose deacetylase (regulator of RNase III)
MKETLLGKRRKVEIYATIGDITQIPTPAIMTAINSGGLWFGGVDGAIQRVAGEFYHEQAGNQMPLNNLDVVVAKGGSFSHRGKFKDVIFVVDDLRSPLDDVVYTGLEAAHKENYDKILIPAMRLGVMKGLVEKTPQETVKKIGIGIERFVDRYGTQTPLTNLTWVVYNDPKTMVILERGLKN